MRDLCLDDVFAEPRPWSQARCCICGRFVSAKSGRIVHEYGDYGSILSSEIECRRHSEVPLANGGTQ
jgi:hypothetical protein